MLVLVRRAQQPASVHKHSAQRERRARTQHKGTRRYCAPRLPALQIIDITRSTQSESRQKMVSIVCSRRKRTHRASAPWHHLSPFRQALSHPPSSLHPLASCATSLSCGGDLRRMVRERGQAKKRVWDKYIYAWRRTWGGGGGGAGRGNVPVPTPTQRHA